MKPDTMKLMLHACCGPCALEPVDVFAGEGVELAIDYANPNIHPRGEYERRLGVLREFVAAPRALPLFTESHDANVWEREAGVFGGEREKRCRACYALRLEMAAARAEEQGFDALSTTLSISPYQLVETIREELEAACARHGLMPVFRDFRCRYAQATRRARELGMYRQNYCGCRFSIAEAAEERARRGEQRARERLEKQVARMYAAAAGVVSQESEL